MKPEIKSVTIYVREEDFMSLLRGDYSKVNYTLTPGEPFNTFASYEQVQVSVSVDTFYRLEDFKVEDEAQTKLPF